jgi:IS5 family transposase
LERNHLTGKDGDRMNAMFAASGYNLRKLLRAFLHLIFGRSILHQEPKLRFIGQPICRPV